MTWATFSATDLNNIHRGREIVKHIRKKGYVMYKRQYMLFPLIKQSAN